MKRRFLTALGLAIALAAPAAGQVEIREGKFWFNGIRQEQVWGRTAFKCAAPVTYHFTGQGGGKYSLGHVQRFIEKNSQLFGRKPFVLRVFLETAGWEPCDEENGVPENCMWGSEPRDQGFWEYDRMAPKRSPYTSRRDQLRDGARQQHMDATGAATLQWFYAISQEYVDSGHPVAFELVIDATLKHDSIPKNEIDHVIRQVGVRMGALQDVYPRALIIPNLRNEIFAHNQSGHSLAEVNMWAVRWDRDQYWISAPKIIDDGGGNTFPYDVGPEDGKYRAGLVHPSRGTGWQSFPTPTQLQVLRTDARGMPVGANESMYYVEAEDIDRARGWYRTDGWTTDWARYESFLNHQLDAGLDYFIVHDEKGAQCDPEWPRAETRVDRWIRDTFGGGGPGPPDPPTPPPPNPIAFDHLIDAAYLKVLMRVADPGGVEAYNEWLRGCFSDPAQTLCIAQVEDALARSDEFKERFTR